MQDSAALEREIARAKEAIARADILFVLTGAGCSRDSGLPTFNEVPGYLDLCTPRALRDCPDDFYSFFVAAQRRYESTPPHSGYQALARLCARPRRETFVATSNVDRALERSGIASVAIHGNVEASNCGLVW